MGEWLFITLALFLALGLSVGYLLGLRARPDPSEPPVDFRLIAVTEDGRELPVETTRWNISDGQLHLKGMILPVDKTAVVMGVVMISGNYRRALDPFSPRIHLWPGDSIEVTANLWFSAQPDGEGITVRVEEPFCQVIAPSYGHPTTIIRAGVITGIHAGTNKLLVRFEDGRTDQLDGYGGLLKPLNKATADELIRLKDEETKIDKQLKTLLSANNFDARKATEAAINEASQTTPTKAY